jgi:hypothetical protein
MVSTLSYLLLSSASLRSRAQSQAAVRHFLQTTPPMSLMKSTPSITKLPSPSFRIPTSLAMAVAVMRLSPVTIRTVIPALWHLAMASGTYLRGMSLTPAMQSSVKPVRSTAKTPFSSLDSRSSVELIFL